MLLMLSVFVPMLFAGISSLRRAEEAQQRGEFHIAAQEYAHAARFLFWRGDLYEQAGISAAQAGQFSSAVDYFSQGADFSEQGWVWLCTAHIQLEDLSSAIEACNEGVKSYDAPSLYQLLAFIHRAQKDTQAERTALENQTRLDKTDAYAAYRLGLLLTLSSPEAALTELTRASTLNPEVDSAVQTLRAALALSGQESDPSTQRIIIGQAFGLVQDWELAHAAFEQAVSLDVKNAEAWAWLGEAKQHLGGDGSEELDQALALDRKSANVHALRALRWSRLGDFEKMLAEYRYAAGLEPENPRWQVGMAEAYTKSGDLISALAAYRSAVELAPDQADYLRLLAIFCAENNVQVEQVGLPAAQKAVTLSANDPVSLAALGYVYLSSGRYASAEESLTLAITLAPDYYPAHLHLALTYLAQGNRIAAFNSLTYVRDAPGAGADAETARQLLDKYFR